MTLASKYPFCSPEELAEKSEVELEALNSVKKIQAFYDNKDLYYGIIEKHPEQKHPRDKGRPAAKVQKPYVYKPLRKK